MKTKLLAKRCDRGMWLVNSLAGLILFFVAGLVHAQVLVANDDSFGIPFVPVGDPPFFVEAYGVLNNDTIDLGDGELAPAGENGATSEILTDVSNGTLSCPDYPALSLCPDGSFEYTPGVDFTGTDSFTYQAVSVTDVSLPATVTLTACTEEFPLVFSCWQEASYLEKLAENGFNAYLESFEGIEWDTVRSTFDTTNSATEIISQGITWTTNHQGTNDITTGTGPALTGQWGVFDPEHGYATGSSADCDLDTPPDSCLFHDGVSGKIQPGATVLNGVGGYITGFTGSNIEIVLYGTTSLDGTTSVVVGRLPDPDHYFFGLIDTSATGFNHFEFREIDGKVGQERLIFADDFIFGTTDEVPVNNPPVLDAIGDRLVFEGDLLSFVLTASEPDGDIWGFTMEGAPAGSSLVNNGDGTATFNWTPDVGQAADYPVSFTVTDTGLPQASDSETITITVASKMCISCILYLLL